MLRGITPTERVPTRERPRRGPRKIAATAFRNHVAARAWDRQLTLLIDGRNIMKSARRLLSISLVAATFVAGVAAATPASAWGRGGWGRGGWGGVGFHPGWGGGGFRPGWGGGWGGGFRPLGWRLGRRVPARLGLRWWLGRLGRWLGLRRRLGLPGLWLWVGLPRLWLWCGHRRCGAWRCGDRSDCGSRSAAEPILLRSPSAPIHLRLCQRASLTACSFLHPNGMGPHARLCACSGAMLLIE